MFYTNNYVIDVHTFNNVVVILKSKNIFHGYLISNYFTRIATSHMNTQSFYILYDIISVKLLKLETLRNQNKKMRLYGFLAKKVGDLTIKYSNFPESYVKRSYEQVGIIRNSLKFKCSFENITYNFFSDLFHIGLLEESFELSTICKSPNSS